MHNKPEPWAKHESRELHQKLCEFGLLSRSSLVTGHWSCLMQLPLFGRLALSLGACGSDRRARDGWTDGRTDGRTEKKIDGIIIEHNAAGSRIKLRTVAHGMARCPEPGVAGWV